jgi:hypothetical protein
MASMTQQLPAMPRLPLLLLRQRWPAWSANPIYERVAVLQQTGEKLRLRKMEFSAGLVFKPYAEP